MKDVSGGTEATVTAWGEAVVPNMHFPRFLHCNIISYQCHSQGADLYRPL